MRYFILACCLGVVFSFGTFPAYAENGKMMMNPCMKKQKRQHHKEREQMMNNFMDVILQTVILVKEEASSAKSKKKAAELEGRMRGVIEKHHEMHNAMKKMHKKKEGRGEHNPCSK